MTVSTGVPAAMTAWAFPAAVHFANARQVVDQASSLLAHPASAPGTGGATGATAYFDLSACASFDSSLLAVLLELERRARARGVACRFASPPDKLLALAQLYDVASLLFDAAAAPEASAADGAIRSGRLAGADVDADADARSVRA